MKLQLLLNYFKILELSGAIDTLNVIDYQKAMSPFEERQSPIGFSSCSLGETPSLNSSFKRATNELPWGPPQRNCFTANELPWGPPQSDCFIANELPWGPPQRNYSIANELSRKTTLPNCVGDRRNTKCLPVHTRTETEMVNLIVAQRREYTITLKKVYQLNQANLHRYLYSLSISWLALIAALIGVQPLSAKEVSLIETAKHQDSSHHYSELLTKSLPTPKPITQERDNSQQKSFRNSAYPLSQGQTFSEIKINNQDLIVAQNSDDIPEEIVVKNFKVVGSSVFSQEELAKELKPYRNRPLTLSELFQARSVITELYTERGYVNSGAYIPPEQELEDGPVTITIAVLEGQLERINVSGTKHLIPQYISSRLEAAAGKPLNVNSLLSGLQLLRLNPLIDNISAELSAGIHPGTSLLDIEIEEADVFNISTSLNNNRSPSVGSNQRSVGLNHGNLFGFGDQFNFNYTNTDGSNSFDFAYALPVNTKNGTIKAAYSSNDNDVIEEPFEPLNIESKSQYYELSFRQPVILKPNQEFSLGLGLSHTDSESFLLDETFPLSRGADENGETRISAIRLFQEFVNRDDKQVLAFRSQFSIGVDALNATINDDEPDSTFFAWRGQSQWVRRLDEDFLLLLRADAQLSGGSLVPLEQFRIGGVSSARGYRQDLSLGDNGLFASAELRIPILRWRKVDGLFQIAPFVDVGTVWNNDEVEIANTTLPSLGVGLNFAAGTNFNARLDWGIPLVNVDNEGDSLQEDGIYFSVDYNFF
ncbi:ShlB/FhaC/HecB family hemolysin secretion/activation protein [Pleurocapsa sp. PCC 7319]|uniref:ShlB/FhaC/HecB family hemolysin secretion/activation protein n=1 Tax=Pleurocapsa sp. PCC 7319 TaxID=118161 RepID=UPI0003610ABA|nr:ShlB/FhaC/HecB family hemolysin secretion/activation protein [Pleurocapsa sp. PCC 7319]